MYYNKIFLIIIIFHTDEDDLYHAILWALTVNRSRTIDFELDFDPTTDFHTYILVVNDGENPETEVRIRF